MLGWNRLPLTVSRPGGKISKGGSGRQNSEDAPILRPHPLVTQSKTNLGGLPWWRSG